MHALKDSLSAIETMFQDVISEHGGTEQMSPKVREQLEAAQRLVTGIRTQAVVPAVDPQKLVERLDAEDLAKKLSYPEKHIMRLMKDRGAVSTVVLGSGADRLYRFGILSKEGSQARLTEKGMRVMAILQPSR